MKKLAVLLRHLEPARPVADSVHVIPDDIDRIDSFIADILARRKTELVSLFPEFKHARWYVDVVKLQGA